MDPVAASRILQQVKKLVVSLCEKGYPTSQSDHYEPEADDPMDIWSHHKTLAMQSITKMAKPLPSSLNLDTEIAMFLSIPVAANHRANPLELWQD